MGPHAAGARHNPTPYLLETAPDQPTAFMSADPTHYTTTATPSTTGGDDAGLADRQATSALFSLARGQNDSDDDDDDDD